VAAIQSPKRFRKARGFKAPGFKARDPVPKNSQSPSNPGQRPAREGIFKARQTPRIPATLGCAFKPPNPENRCHATCHGVVPSRQTSVLNYVTMELGDAAARLLHSKKRKIHTRRRVNFLDVNVYNSYAGELAMPEIVMGRLHLRTVSYCK
jgi:hypothetical protein